MEGRDRPTGERMDHESVGKMPEMAEADEGAKGELESVRIRPAANGGFIASCERRPPLMKGKGENMPMSYSPPKDYAFSTMDELFTYLKDELA